MNFQEEQSINSYIKYVYIIITLVVFSIGFNQLWKGPNQELKDWIGFSVSLLLMILIYLSLFNSKAQTKVNRSGIHYKYWPWIWHFKTIAWREIEKVEFFEVSPLSDYGGYGYRFTGFKEKGIILNRGTALKIYLKEKNKKFTLTTKSAKKLEKTVNYWMKEKEMYG